jgi:hypothetical protein
LYWSSLTEGSLPPQLVNIEHQIGLCDYWIGWCGWHHIRPAASQFADQLLGDIIALAVEHHFDVGVR